MADYNVDLAAPQAAGSGPVAPVQKQVTAMPNPWLGFAVGAADMLFKVAKDQKEQDKQNQIDAVVSEFTKKQTGLNDAVAQGTISPVQAAARQRANFSQYAAQYPSLIKHFKETNNALTEGTDLGQFKAEEQKEFDREKTLETDMQKAGFPVYAGMPKQLLEAHKTAYLTGIKVQGEFENLAKRSKEAREAGEWEQKRFTFEAKERGAMLLSEYGNAHVGSVTALIQELQTMPDKNQAKLRLADRFAQLESGIAALSGSHPELASNWKGVFANLRKVGEDALDPTKKAEEVESQLKIIKTQAQLMALSDPRMVKAYALNSLAPSTAALMPDLNKATLDALNNISSTRGDTKIQIIGGDGEVVKVFDALKVATKEYVRNPASPQIKEELTEAHRTILTQIDKALVTGAKPADLAKAADYVASPEFAQAMKNGLVDKDHAKNALTAFEYVYAQNVSKGVTEKLGEKVPGAGGKTFGQSVELTWAGTGVQLGKKFDDGGSGWGIGKSSAYKNMSVEQAAEARREQIKFTEDMAPALKAINLVVKAGAHLEGHQDYAMYWEANKHRILPGYFPDPEADHKWDKNTYDAKADNNGIQVKPDQIKPGYTFDGWRFKGGDPGKKESWEKM